MLNRTLTWAPAQNPFQLLQVRFATKKTGGSTKNGRDSNPKYLGLKCGDGQAVETGRILVRQRGFKWHAGDHVVAGRDHTLHANTEGRVKYHYDILTQKRYVSIIPHSIPSPIITSPRTTYPHFTPAEKWNNSLLYPSRDLVKKALADKVDAKHYLSLDATGRYHYMMDLCKQVGEQVQVFKEKSKLEAIQTQGSRKFNLVDLSLI